MEITIVKVQSGPHRAVVARPRLPPQNDPLVGAHIDDLLAAEGLVAAFSAFPGTGPEPELDPGQIERIRARITELNEEWQAAGPGERLRLQWPSAVSGSVRPRCSGANGRPRSSRSPGPHRP